MPWPWTPSFGPTWFRARSRSEARPCARERASAARRALETRRSLARVRSEFRAADVKSLRVAVSSLLDMLHLSARTIEAFAPPSLPAAQSA